MYNINYVIVIVFNCTHTYARDYILVVYNITTLNLKMSQRKLFITKMIIKTIQSETSMTTYCICHALQLFNLHQLYLETDDIHYILHTSSKLSDLVEVTVLPLSTASQIWLKCLSKDLNTNASLPFPILEPRVSTLLSSIPGRFNYDVGIGLSELSGISLMPWCVSVRLCSSPNSPKPSNSGSLVALYIYSSNPTSCSPIIELSLKKKKQLSMCLNYLGT